MNTDRIRNHGYQRVIACTTQPPAACSSRFRIRMVAWELTRSCNLACVHCRASAERGPYPGELSTREVLRVMDEIASVGKPVIILTGGEPLLRADIFDLATLWNGQGFPDGDGHQRHTVH